MGIAERKERQREALRKNILKAALQLAGQEGWQAVSMRKIADAIEYSPPVIYEHFKSKDDLLFELHKKGVSLMGKAMAGAADENLSPKERLLAISAAYWEFAFSNPELYQVVFSMMGVSCEAARCGEHGIANGSAGEKDGFQKLADTLAELKPAAELPKTIDAWRSMMHGYVSLTMNGRMGSREATQESMLQAIEIFTL